MLAICLTALAVGAAGEALASTGQARCVVLSDAPPYPMQLFDVTWFRPVHMNCLQLGDVMDKERLVDHCAVKEDTLLVLDGKIATPEQLLQPGRRVMFWENRHAFKLVAGATDNLEKVYGRVKECDAARGSVVLTVYAGDVPPESWVLMSDSNYVVRKPFEKTFRLTEKTLTLKDGAPAGRDEVLAAGNQIELLPERARHVVAAWSERPPLHVQFGEHREAYMVTVKGLGPLTVVKEADGRESPAELRMADGFRIAFGSHIEPVSYKGLVHPRLRVGLRGVMLRDGKGYRMVFPSADDSILEGTIKSVAPGGKSFVAQVAEGKTARDVEVAPVADSAFILDGRASTAAETLKPGRLVRIAPPRPAVLDWSSQGNVYVNANVFYLNETQGTEMPETKPFAGGP
jgi:hypothetical protein